MKLKTHLKNLPIDRRKEFANRCGTTLNYLKLVGYGAKPCSETLAMAIERESNGAVTVEELRPDLIEHWNYIRGTAKRLPLDETA